MKRATLKAVAGAMAAAAIVAAPALARNPYTWNPYIYNGGANYNAYAGYGNSLGYWNNSTMNIDQRKNNLALRINQAFAAGRLRPGDAQRLTNDLNKLSQRESSYLNRNRGALTTMEQVRLDADLGAISLRLDKDMIGSRIW